jgi:ketosteroid isomerase-like protein
MLTGRWFRTETFRAQPETSSSPDSATDGEERAIRAVMASYHDALNNGSTDAALALYAEDGVFMPPYSQSAVGKEAVRKAMTRFSTS